MMFSAVSQTRNGSTAKCLHVSIIIRVCVAVYDFDESPFDCLGCIFTISIVAEGWEDQSTSLVSGVQTPSRFSRCT